jgi:hypothetical protein
MYESPININTLSRLEFYSLRGAEFRNDKTDEASKELLRRDPGAPDTAHTPQIIAKRLVNPSGPVKTILFSHATGTGKCHGENTPILMADGTVKLVQYCATGDKIMGDDGAPRTILSTTQGYGMIYKVKMARGVWFTCNADHILTLRHDKRGVIDISLREYLRWVDQGDYKLYKHSPDGASDDVAKAMSLGASHAAYGLIRPIAPYSPHLRSRRGYLQGLGINCAGYYGPFCEKLANHAAFMANSVGYMAVAVAAKGYYFVSVQEMSGKFSVKSIGAGTYYGFTVSGNSRYLLGDFTVTHNSRTALEIASSFIEESYKKIYQGLIAKQPPGAVDYNFCAQNSPTVFVLGWDGTTRAFMRDLLKYPEFKIVTQADLKELAARTQLAQSGNAADIKYAKDFTHSLRRRVQNKAKGGFYQFYGYIEFVNKLFSGRPLIEIEDEVTRRVYKGEQITLEQVVIEHIARGEITVNWAFARLFHGSLLIVDEFHNLYNSVIKNNRGVAIMYLLSIIQDMWMIGLSATPTNNSPTEVCEYISLITGKPVNKADYFNGRRITQESISRLAELSRGHYSFLQDTSTKYFPKVIFAGESLEMEHAMGSVPAGPLPYLKFIECPMSEYHQSVYEAYVASRMGDDIVQGDAEDLDAALESSTCAVPIPIDGQSIYDMVFPTGVFRSRDAKAAFLGLDAAARDELRLEVKKLPTAMVYAGDYLRAENIGKYSAKYKRMWDILFDDMKAAAGDRHLAKKTMIYHNMVRMSGVLLIQEMLVANGFIHWNSSPIASTLCFHCGHPKRDHGEISPVGTMAHSFVAARLINIHSETDRVSIENMLNAYVSLGNLYGDFIGVIIGSRKIKESFEVIHTRRLIISTFPTSISTLLQIIGRVVRKGSHAALTHKDVEINILVSTVNKTFPHSSPVSPELYRYAEKLQDYKTIQLIERALNENAIDGPLLCDINKSTAAPSNSLGNLPFTPVDTLPEITEPATTTFYAYNFARVETGLITGCIKRLFLERPAWTYDELWKTVRSPPFGMEVNPAMFQENNFIIALSSLISHDKAILLDTISSPQEDSKYIWRDGIKHVIGRSGQFYILFPIGEVRQQTIQRAQITPIIDADSFLRKPRVVKSKAVGLHKFLMVFEHDKLYASHRDRLFGFYSAGTFSNAGFITKNSFEFQTLFIEECITGLATGANEQMHGMYKAVLDYMSGFGAIIYGSEVAKYKDVMKQLSPWVASAGAVGYCTPTSARVYNNGTWVNVSRVALNRQLVYRENNVIVGLLEPYKDGIVFKLREPKGMGAAPSQDKRTLRQGAACSTKTKNELWEIAASLGISIRKLSPEDQRIKVVCNLIRDNLIAREQKERGKRTMTKYLYSWWDSE